MPMGLSWAFFLAQEVHRSFAAQFVEGVGPEDFVIERRPVPTLSGDGDRALMVYADNAHHLGLCAKLVNAMRESLSLALNAHGLKTHEVVEACHLAECLGARVNMQGGVVDSTAARLYTLRGALRCVISGRPVTGQEIEKVMGTVTFIFLLRRPCLAALDLVYDYVRLNYLIRRPVPTHIAAELKVCLGLLVLCRADLRARWSQLVLSVDASLSGYAVCGKRVESEWAVHDIGQWDERWRFKYVMQAKPRDVVKFCDLDPAVDIDTVFERSDPPSLEIFEDLSFPNVPQKFARQGFRDLWCAPLVWGAAIHLKEAHSLLAAVKHCSRNHLQHGMRFLILSDSMCCVLAVSKGRCSNRVLLHYMRRLAAELLASGIVLRVRWIPSEWNTADSGSRVWESLRPHASRGQEHASAEQIRSAAAAYSSARARMQAEETSSARATRHPRRFRRGRRRLCDQHQFSPGKLWSATSSGRQRQGTAPRLSSFGPTSSPRSAARAPPAGRLCRLAESGPWERARPLASGQSRSTPAGRPQPAGPNIMERSCAGAWVYQGSSRPSVWGAVPGNTGGGQTSVSTLSRGCG